MDIIKLFEDFKIDHTPQNRRGWISTHCVWCKDTGYHMAYHPQINWFKCWKCGWHATIPTISRILGVNYNAVKGIIDQYGGSVTDELPVITPVNTLPHQLPNGTMPLQANHRKYIESRNFNPDLLVKLWGIVGTGPVSKLDNIDFKHRIVAPIYWADRQVSFQARDITNRQGLRYITCPKPREIVHHKHILYGRQQDWLPMTICTEGITDVWRLGVHAVATFGIEFTFKQVCELVKSFKRVFVMFDDEPQAQAQADRLVSELLFHNVDAIRIDIVGDPGGMKQVDADYLVKQLLSRPIY